MKVRRFVTRPRAFPDWPSRPHERLGPHPHWRRIINRTAADLPLGTDQRGDFVKLVRESTARFRDVAVAEAEEYVLQFGCVSGPDAGAMGIHFVNMPLVFDGVAGRRRDPEIVIYEPTSNGRLAAHRRRLSGLKADWEAKHPEDGAAAAHGTALSFVRVAQSLRAPGRSTRCMSGHGRRTPPARS